MSVSALECMVEREREEKHNIENTNAEKLFHLSGMRFGFDLFGFFFFFICRNSSEPILSIFQAALISNGTCKYSAAFHHFGVRAKHLLLHSCDLLGRESMSCMMTGIVFFISLSVVFPGKNGYL